MRAAGFFFIIFLLSIFTAGAQAAAGGYTISPHTDDPALIESGLVDSSGADSTITFWQLPLWIQIFYVAGILAAFLGLFKVFPIVLAKVGGILENENRKNIYEYISQNPGSNIADISASLHINRGSVKYHLSRLGLENRVVSLRTGKSKRLYQNSKTYDEYEKIIISCLRNETGKKLLVSILENPGITNQALSERFDLSKSTIHWYLENFCRLDIITPVTDGKYKKWFIKPVVRRTLKKTIYLRDIH